jgi:hypothetical protein
LLELKLIHVHL